MIDLERENLVPIARAGQRLPMSWTGKPITRQTICRWAKHGRRGVKLEFAAVGGIRYTSVEALQRFIDTVTQREMAQNAANELTLESPTPTKLSPSELRMHEQSMAYLRSQGLAD